MTAADPADHQVLVVGEALVDLVQRTDGSRDEAPGGSPANVALTLGQLGRHPHLLTSLGDDDRGLTVRAWLEDSGVRVSAGVRTATATALLDATGTATYEFDLAWAVNVDRADAADVLPIGSIATVLEPGSTDVVRLVEARRASATIAFDPSIQPALIDDDPPTRAELAAA